MGTCTTASMQRSKGSSVGPVLSCGLYVGSGNWAQVVSLMRQDPLCWPSGLCFETGSLSLDLTALPRLPGAAIQGSSCLQFLRAGMAGACYPPWLFMCVEDLPSSPHACAAGTLLTESFHQPQWMLSLVPSYRQGNRGVSEGLESD